MNDFRSTTVYVKVQVVIELEDSLLWIYTVAATNFTVYYRDIGSWIFVIFFMNIF
jgi:hypothetical protein